MRQKEEGREKRKTVRRTLIIEENVKFEKEISSSHRLGPRKDYPGPPPRRHMLVKVDKRS